MKLPRWFAVAAISLVSALLVRSEPRLMAQFGDETVPVTESRDGQLWAIRNGQAVAVGPAERLVIDDPEIQAPALGLWSPDYSIRARTDQEKRRSPESHLAEIKLVYAAGDGAKGKQRPTRPAVLWPGAFQRPGAIVFAWVADGKIVRAEGHAYRQDTKRPFSISSEILVPEDLVGGQPIILVWEHGRFVVPSPESADARINAAVAAAIQDRGEELAELLKAGVKPNAVAPGSAVSLLGLAAEAGSVSAIDVLLAAKATVDFGGRNWPTPLLAAAGNGRAEAVARLLAAKASRNAQDGAKQTPLYLAAGRGHAESARLLIAAKAILDTHARDSTSTFTETIDGGYAEVARLILAAGFKYDFGQDQCQRVLFSQAARGNTGVVRLLLERKVKPTGMFRGETALHVAAAVGDIESVRLLRAAGAGLNQQNAAGATPIAKAAAAGADAVVAALIEDGAEPEIADLQGNTALHAAVLARSARSVELLLEAGARVDVQNKRGMTPLELALLSDVPDVAKLLHGKGARLNANSLVAVAALDGAIRSDLDEILEEALQAGISPSFEIKPGWPLPMVADAYRAKRCSQLLERAIGSSISSPIVKATDLTVRPKVQAAVLPRDPRPLDDIFPASSVSLEVVIDAGGVPVFARVLNAENPELGYLVRLAMAQWKFQPAQKDAVAVPASVVVPIVFPSSQERAHDLWDVDVPPTVMRQTAPKYPFSMQKSGLVGQVVLTFVVNQSGKTESIEVNRSSHPDFEQAAIEALETWTFKPAVRNGKPVNAKLRVPIVFGFR